MDGEKVVSKIGAGSGMPRPVFRPSLPASCGRAAGSSDDFDLPPVRHRHYHLWDVVKFVSFDRNPVRKNSWISTPPNCGKIHDTFRHRPQRTTIKTPPAMLSRLGAPDILHLIGQFFSASYFSVTLSYDRPADRSASSIL
jgi:hypothetical protein